MESQTHGYHRRQSGATGESTPTSSRLTSSLASVTEDKENTLLENSSLLMEETFARRKTGTTPLRVEKSPRRRFPTGLTPIRPESSGRKKLGLEPIRPRVLNTSSVSQDLNHTNCADGLVFGARRKTGVLPIRPGQSINNLLDQSNGIFPVDRLPSKLSFGVKVSELSMSLKRRRSGVLPIRPVSKNNLTVLPPTQEAMYKPNIQQNSNFDCDLARPHRQPASGLNSTVGAGKKLLYNDTSLVAKPRLNQETKQHSARKQILAPARTVSFSGTAKTDQQKLLISKATQTDNVDTAESVQGIGTKASGSAEETLEFLLDKKRLLECELSSVVKKISNLELHKKLLQLNLSEEDIEEFSDDSETLPNNFERSTFLAHPSNADGIYKNYRQTCSFLETPKPTKTIPNFQHPAIAAETVQTPGLRGRFKAQLASLFE